MRVSYGISELTQGADPRVGFVPPNFLKISLNIPKKIIFSFQNYTFVLPK